MGLAWGSMGFRQSHGGSALQVVQQRGHCPLLHNALHTCSLVELPSPKLPHDVTLKGSQCHHRALQGLQHPQAARRQQPARSTARYLAKRAELPLQYNVRESGIKATLENHSTREKDLKLLFAGLATSYNSESVSRLIESTLRLLCLLFFFIVTTLTLPLDFKITAIWNLRRVSSPPKSYQDQIR